MNKQITTHKPEAPWMPAPSGILQRACACGNHTTAGGDCESCKKNQAASTLQRSTTRQAATAEAPPIVHDVLRSSGQPLDLSTRAFFESRFGHDFSHVRVHTDTRAAESAQAVNALAYTVGRDIVFGAGQYAPGTNAGQRLLAHELTHTAQQGAGAYSSPHELTIGAAHDNHEQEADAIAVQTGMNGTQVGHRLSHARPGLQRQPKSPAKDEEKRPEIKITPATRTIPQAEAAQQAVPIAPAPAGLPDKSPPGKSTPSDKVEKGPEIETSYQGSIAEKKITTNIEVGIPIKQFKPVLIFGQPLVFAKELKAEVEIGPPQGPAALVAPPQAALKISLKALSYEIESLKSHVKGLEEFGLGVTSEAEINPAAPFARPNLGVKGVLGAEYQIGRTPISLQGNIGYEVKFPSQGPATAAPTFDFGFKIKFP